MVAHVLGAHMLDRMYDGHFKMTLVRLSEADIVFDEGISTGQFLAVCNPHIGGHNGTMIKVERLDVHFFHAYILS